MNKEAANELGSAIFMASLVLSVGMVVAAWVVGG